MALNIDGKSKIDFSGRNDAFAWIWLCQGNDFYFELDIPKFLDNKVCNDINKEILNVQERNLKKMALSDLKWIDGSDRQCKWIEWKLNWGNSFKVPRHMRGVDRCTAVVDYWCCANDQGLDVVSRMKHLAVEWTELVVWDGMFEWINDAEAGDQIRFIWEKIDEIELMKLPMPNSREGLMTCFDSMVSDRRVQRDYLNRRRQAWKRRSRELRDSSKACSFVISTNAANLLKSMAGKYNVSQAYIVDLLIREEYERGAYIQGQLNEKLHG